MGRGVREGEWWRGSRVREEVGQFVSPEGKRRRITGRESGRKGGRKGVGGEGQEGREEAGTWSEGKGSGRRKRFTSGNGGAGREEAGEGRRAGREEGREGGKEEDMEPLQIQNARRGDLEIAGRHLRHLRGLGVAAGIPGHGCH